MKIGERSAFNKFDRMTTTKIISRRSFNSLTACCFILILSCAFITSSKAEGSTATSPNANGKQQQPPQITLTSIEDIELLTYFLLWKNDYFDSAPELNTIQGDFEDDSNKLSDGKLREFIEKLKINHVIPTNKPSRSRFNLTKECSDGNLAEVFGRHWSSTSASGGVALGGAFSDEPGARNRTRAICEAASGCRSAKQLIELIGLQPLESQSASFTGKPRPRTTLSQSIARLCPLMLFQLQEKECVDQRDDHVKAMNRPSPGAVWGFGLLFVTIVSFCSLAGVGILPFFTDVAYEVLITVLQGLAVGSLLGSALFHLIPQAFNLISAGSSSEEKYEYLYRALIIFGGIYLFFWSERLMKIVSEYRRRLKKAAKEVALPSNTNSIEPEVENAEYRQVLFKNHLSVHHPPLSNGGLEAAVAGDETTPVELYETAKDLDAQQAQANLLLAGNQNSVAANHNNHSKKAGNGVGHHHHHDHGHHHHHSGKDGGSGEIATIAWMIIIGDGLHNFIDGITIGAAFSQSIMEGISISVAVICEEFPHELGDFAILLSSGMTWRKAVGYNFLSACTCYLGMIVGILLGDLADATPYIFALAGGMFLYISLVDMMGELSSNLELAGQKRGLRFTIKMLILQNVGLLLGISIMFLLAMYSDKIQFDGLVPPKNSDMPFTDSYKG